MGVKQTPEAYAAPSFKWPVKIKSGTMTELLDPAATAAPRKFPRQTSACAKVKKFYASARRANNLDPEKHCIVVDCGSSGGSWRYEAAPCLTSARAVGGGFWLSTRRRRTNLNEMYKIQGMTPVNTMTVSDGQVAKCIGNAFTQTVIARILVQLLTATGLSGVLKDPWTTTS